MNNVAIQLAVGVVDGSNVTFHTPSPYDPGTGVQVFLDGQLLNPTQYALSSPDVVLLAEAPRDGEVVQVYYRPT